VLALIECPGLIGRETGHDLPENILMTLDRITQDTDIKGWYEELKVIGIMFMQSDQRDTADLVYSLSVKITNALSSSLTSETLNGYRLAFQTFPENNAISGRHGEADLLLYADNLAKTDPKHGYYKMKAALDISMSMLALTLLAPLLLNIALAIKLTSRGPVFFRQQRIGRNGKPFTFLKFRSMYVGNDESIHRKYVEQFISGCVGKDAKSGHKVLFKLQDDPRVTKLGRVLRSTSLDELPQLLNVLRGEMSLVGPRPPVPYEFERYEMWHKRRLLNVKPGITGLWQVGGRSSVTFEDMVRLDLKYVDSCSIWLDLKILLRTPAAVVSGEGAC
jgi:exopolysaccharide biosynthesis polyprenyl glycosylphosphotransferase